MKNVVACLIGLGLLTFGSIGVPTTGPSTPPLVRLSAAPADDGVALEQMISEFGGNPNHTKECCKANCGLSNCTVPDTCRACFCACVIALPVCKCNDNQTAAAPPARA
jgi:hypothetical protein